MLPDTIVLDTREFLRVIVEELAKSPSQPVFAENVFYFVTELMTDLVTRLHDRVQGPRHLHSMLIDIAGGIYPSGAGYVDPGLVGPISALGNYLVEEFRGHGLYDLDNHLRYRLEVQGQLQHNLDLVLRKLPEAV